MVRQFSSYGPVDAKVNFAVERRELVNKCVTQLVGLAEEAGGHYFTIWGPRQTGKTWLMRQAVAEIRKRHGEMWDLPEYRKQAARYAKQLGLEKATLVVFAPVEDDSLLGSLAGEADEDGVHVVTVPFGWV